MMPGAKEAPAFRPGRRHPHAVTLIAIARVGGLRLATEVAPINVRKPAARPRAAGIEARV